uniref:Uncharacterized protein n=1 Tax=Anguilla anguilla TaxID=7936 RepID=A0A0E9P6Q7_ANGAN
MMKESRKILFFSYSLIIPFITFSV